MFETSENHVKDVYSQQAESGELSQFQPISSGKMAITHYSKVEKKSRKKGGQNPPRFRHHFVYLLTYYVFIISLSLMRI